MLCGSNRLSTYNINNIDLLNGFWYNEVLDRVIYKYGDNTEKNNCILAKIQNNKNIAKISMFPTIDKVYKDFMESYWVSPVIKCYDLKHHCITHSRIEDIKKIEEKLSPIIKIIDYYGHDILVTHDTQIYSPITKNWKYIDLGEIFLKYDCGEPVYSNILDIIRSGEYTDNIYEIKLEMDYYYPYIKNGFILK